VIGYSVTVARSLLLFGLAALAEIGGAWLIWQGVREHRSLLFIVALGGYGFVAAFQPDPNFGRVLAAYGGIFVAGSLAWGVLVDKFRPDRYDLIGAAICLAGVAVIMYAHAADAARSTKTRLRQRSGDVRPERGDHPATGRRRPQRRTARPHRRAVVIEADNELAVTSADGSHCAGSNTRRPPRRHQ
jgi:small multidrug resistance family-3 protein